MVDLLKVLLEENQSKCAVEDRMAMRLFRKAHCLDGVLHGAAGAKALTGMAMQINPELSSAQGDRLVAACFELAESDNIAGGRVFPEHFSAVARRTGLHRFTSLFRFFTRHCGDRRGEEDEGRMEEEEEEEEEEGGEARFGGAAPTLSPTNLAALMRDLGEEVTPAELQAMVAALDTDGNGAIDWPEFVGYFAEWQLATAAKAARAADEEEGGAGTAAAPTRRQSTEEKAKLEAAAAAAEAEERHFVAALTIRESALFEGMADAVKQCIVDNVEPVHAEPAEAVLRQGELGDCMYFVASGLLDVVITTAEGDQRTVATLEPPDFFGERALLAGDPTRSASIVARQAEGGTVDGGCELLKLARSTFLSTCAAFPEFARAMQRKAAGYAYVDQVPMFRGRPSALTWDILGRVHEQERLQPGVVVVAEGDVGECMYFVREGALDVEVAGVGKVHTLGPSDFFGEKALLGGAKARRTATVTTSEACVLLSLTRAAFAEVLALHPDFKKEVVAQSGVARETIIQQRQSEEA